MFKKLIACFAVLLALHTVKAQMSAQQIDSMRQQITTAKNDSNKVNTILDLANEVGYSDLNKALEYTQQGYQLSQKINYERGKGRALYSLAVTYTDMGNYAMADSFLNLAEKKFIEMKDKRQLSKLYNARGSRNFMVSNYVLAADFYKAAAEGFDSIGDTAFSIIAHQNLVAVLGHIKSHDRAVELGKKILSMAEKRGDSLSVGYTLQAMVNDLIYLNRLDEASTYLDRLLNFAHNTADQNLAPEAFSTVGMYHYKRQSYAKAIEYFNESVKRATLLDNKYQLSNHYNSLGLSYCRGRNFPASLAALTKSLELAKQYQNKRAEASASLSLSTLYDSLGDFRNAYKYLFAYSTIDDSLLNSQTRNYTAQLEQKYESNKKENEILRLQQVEQQKDFEIRKRNNYIIAGIALIALLCVILYLLNRNYKNKQELARQQSGLLSLQAMINGQEKERTRIARDLHDGLGGIFSTVKMHYSTLQQHTPDLKVNPLYKKTLDLINSASDELRKVAHNMMPEVLMKVGLVEALRDFCNNVSAGNQLTVKLQAFGMDKRLSTSKEIMLYRIVQELVNNVVKHAEASQAMIQINREGNSLNLTVEDNGRGFDSQEEDLKRSMGMTTVRNRVDYLDGKLTIDSRKGIGTTVMIDLLLDEN